MCDKTMTPTDKYAERARELLPLCLICGDDVSYKCGCGSVGARKDKNALRAEIARALEQTELEARISEIRCAKTHHLCGTDTRMVGDPCLCSECARQRELRARLAELEGKS